LKRKNIKLKREIIDSRELEKKEKLKLLDSSMKMEILEINLKIMITEIEQEFKN